MAAVWGDHVTSPGAWWGKRYVKLLGFFLCGAQNAVIYRSSTQEGLVMFSARTSPCLAILFLGTFATGCNYLGICSIGEEFREERLPDGSIRARGCMTQDKHGNYRLTGRWDFFYPSGQKMATGSFGYAGDEKDANGIPLDGRDGMWVWWHQNGQRKLQVTYEDPVGLNGLTISWYANGQKESEAAYRWGKVEGPLTTWHENGRKSGQWAYKEGKIQGVVTLWYESGQKKSETAFKEDERAGREIEWYENGQKKSEATYDDGKLVGDKLVWGPDGQRLPDVLAVSPK